jgi:hypothetical protein
VAPVFVEQDLVAGTSVVVDILVAETLVVVDTLVDILVVVVGIGLAADLLDIAEAAVGVVALWFGSP